MLERALDEHEALIRACVRGELRVLEFLAAARSRPFSAHMTVAEFISATRTRELMAELESVVPRGEFLCDHVSFALPDRRFRFAEARRLDLAPRGACAGESARGPRRRMDSSGDEA